MPIGIIAIERHTHDVNLLFPFLVQSLYARYGNATRTTPRCPEIDNVIFVFRQGSKQLRLLTIGFEHYKIYSFLTLGVLHQRLHEQLKAGITLPVGIVLKSLDQFLQLCTGVYKHLRHALSLQL